MPGSWAPTPFREFVLKVHSRCNLKCDYCYMYELADRDLAATVIMSEAVFGKVCQRIADHLGEHSPSSARVVVHGGEPTLAGVPRLVAMSAALRDALRPTPVDILIQSNGVLLDAAAIDTLAAAGVRIGISLDGDRRANDRHRRYTNGRSSYSAAERSVELLSRRPETFAGILSVVDVRNDPLTTYTALLKHKPPRIDFLLPHANWDVPPPDGHGAWLIPIFDHWYQARVRETGIRLFEELLALLLGGQSQTEAVGLSPVATIVINTDGSYEQIDTLRSAYRGAVHTGLNVFRHSLNEALSHPDIRRRQIGAAALSAQCRDCSIHRICGGGYYPHRYKSATGFANPSVYCADMKKLIGHIASRLRTDLVAEQGKRH